MEQDKNSCNCSHWIDGRIYKAGTTVLFILALFLGAKSVSEIKGWGLIGKDVPPQATVNVSGKGEVIVKPDIATFSFGIQEESLVVGDAQDKVAKSENGILAFLKKNGVSTDDIKVSGYNIYPRYDYTQTSPYGSGKQVLAAYVVSEQVEVKVRKISDAGKLIGSIGEIGANNLSGLSFSVDKQDDIMKEARQKAIVDAKEKATRLAKDLGVSLVRIISFSENGPSYPPVYYAKGLMSADSGEVATPELPSGTNKITSEVSVTYEIR